MNNHSIPPQVAQLAATLLQPQPLRRGSLYERRMKCGQASCPCQNDPKAAHGPYFTLTQKVDGKTRSRYVASDQAGLVQRQIAAGRQFRERRGSLYERRMKCGQASYPCQNDPKAAHGPYFPLTQKVDGKTRSRYVASDQAGLVQRQIAADL